MKSRLPIVHKTGPLEVIIPKATATETVIPDVIAPAVITSQTTRQRPHTRSHHARGHHAGGHHPRSYYTTLRPRPGEVCLLAGRVAILRREVEKNMLDSRI